MDFCYDGWTDRVPQKAPTSTESYKCHFGKGGLHTFFCGVTVFGSDGILECPEEQGCKSLKPAAPKPTPKPAAAPNPTAKATT
jgi:hypothetical protein